MKANRKLLLALSAIPALLIILMPWNTTVVPAVRIQVFDEAGKPAAGVLAEQKWEFLVPNSHLERATSTTDAAGYVTWPKRTVRISIANRAVGFGRSLLLERSLYEYGPIGDITAYASDRRFCDTVRFDVNHSNLRPLILTRLNFCSAAGRT